MKQLNKVERPLLIQFPVHPKLNQTTFQKAMDNNLLVIDTRSKDEVAKGHVPNSIHIANKISYMVRIIG